MANQLIPCPRHLLEALRVPYAYPSPTGDLMYLVAAAGGSEGTTRIALSRMLELNHAIPWLPADGDYIVLMLTDGQPVQPDQQPRWLPHATIVEIIDGFRDAVVEQGNLSGHDLIELVEILERAKVTAGAGLLPGQPRATRNRFERRLRVQMHQLTQQLADVTQDYNTAYADHRSSIMQAGMETIMTRLCFEGPVADALELHPTHEPHGFRVTNPEGLASARRLALNIRTACRWGAINRLPHRLAPEGRAKGGSLTTAFQRLILEMPEAANSCRQNSPDARGRSRGVPEIGRGQAMSDLLAAFDPQLLVDAHPLLRAALGAFHLARIRPLGVPTELAAEVALMLLLIERDALPPALPLALHRDRAAFGAALETAIQANDPAMFAEQVCEIAGKSIVAGERMVDRLVIAREHLHVQLRDSRLAMHAKMELAARLLSNVLVSVGKKATESADDNDGELEAMRWLQKHGRLDLIESQDSCWWSSPVVRDILARTALI